MSKHTPGPWSVYKDTRGDLHPWFICADAAPIGDRLPASADSESNANLIAAAPDLLAVLKMIMSRLEDMDRGDGGLTGSDRFAIHEVIATAEGRP